MCGIFGGIVPGGFSEKTLDEMAQLQIHRGPDDYGNYFDKETAIGIRRLSIIDIEGGNQPIKSENDQVVVVCNGEIYNYIELRRSLIKKGYKFSTESDVEVLVHLYQEKGIIFLDDLNGIYAFALYDRKENKLFLVRDRLGVKPLYYYYNNKTLYFSSELKSILAVPGFKKDIDWDALSTYLELMYIPAPSSPFSSIRKVNSGTYLEFTKDKLNEIVYWSPEIRNDTHKSLNTWKREIFEILEDSAKLQLRADVPLGSLLSGGIDSSCVTALAAKNSKNTIRTYNVFWGDAKNKMDERPYAKLIADRYKTDHEVLRIEVEEVLKLLPKLIWHLEEPFADAAFVPTYLISRLAQSKVKVLLNGAGGDELFGGYPRYRNLTLMQRINNIKSSLSPKTNNEWSFYKNTMVGAESNWAQIFPFYSKFPHKEEIEKFFYNNLHKSRINSMMLNDINVYLKDDILFLLDKMTMACSIEARVPLLDHRLVQKSLSIPPRFKISSGQRKYILNKTVEHLLPKKVIYRKKDGFGAPIYQWIDYFKEKSFDPIILNGYMINNGIMNKDYFENDYIKKFTKNNSFYWSYWKILILEIWFQTFIENNNISQKFP
jgi:asparagine synthase (glutamine-hydrolysing)